MSFVASDVRGLRARHPGRPAVASYLTTVRLFTSERGLATMRIKAFRHVHDLPVLTQSTERRGALVSRVTPRRRHGLAVPAVRRVHLPGQHRADAARDRGDVRLLLAAPLAGAASASFRCSPSLRYLQRPMSAAYGVVRGEVGEMLSAIAEPVVGAQVPSARTRSRSAPRTGSTPPIEAYRRPRPGLRRSPGSRSRIGGSRGRSGQRRRPDRRRAARASTGDVTLGEILAFMFLVTLFVGPVQIATQVLTDAQSAFAGWRRVLGVIGRPRPTWSTRARPGVSSRAGRSTSSSRTCPSPTRKASWSCAMSPCRSSRIGGSRWSARPARARRRSPSC